MSRIDDWLGRFGFTSRARRREKARRRLVGVEPLEDRRMLTGIEVYQDSTPWFDEDRVVSVLESDLGLVQGTDFDVNPTADLKTGIPADTEVVIIPSNSLQAQSTFDNVNDPVTQMNLHNFVTDGGVLVVHMSDYSPTQGYTAPGLNGSIPGLAVGFLVDLVASSNHPIVLGPDQLAGTSDDLTQAGVQASSGGAGYFGVLPTLPTGAEVILSATVSGDPLLAAYPLGAGTVLVTTQHLEFGNYGDSVGDTGLGLPRQTLINELFYAIDLVAPTADAGGPYSVVEGGSVVLDASGSSDPLQAAATLVYEWDLDGDGTFGETGSSAAAGDETGITPTFSAAGLDGPDLQLLA